MSIPTQHREEMTGKVWGEKKGQVMFEE